MTKSVGGAPVFPRIYRMEGTAKLVFNGLGITMSVFAIATLHSLFGGNHESVRSALPVAFFACFAFWFFYTANQQIILYEDGIERVTWFSRRMLKREDIRGWYGKSYRGYTYVLVPRESRGANMYLRPLWRWDKAFFEWMKAIPHLKG